MTGGANIVMFSIEVIAKPSALLEAWVSNSHFSGIARRVRNVPEGFAITYYIFCLFLDWLYT